MKIKGIVRWYNFSQLTLSILGHLKPYKDLYTSINEEIISISTNSEKADRLSELQIKSSSIEDFISLSNELDNTMKSLIDLELLRKDKELGETVEEEISEKEAELSEIEEKAIEMILEKDPDDHSNVIIEIKPGVGGSESSLFTEDMLNMYLGYAGTKN